MNKNFRKAGLIQFFSFYTLLCLISTYIVLSSAISSNAAVSVKWQKNYSKAMIFFKNKQYNSALISAKKALTENKNPYTYELAANILQFKKQYKSSIDYYKKSIIYVLKSKNFKNPNKFSSSVKNSIALNYLLIGNNFLKRRKINLAIKSYKKGLSYASKKRLVNFLTLNLAMGYENSSPNHLRKAVYYTNQAIKNNSSNFYAYFLKGRAEYGLKRFNSSLNDLKIANKLNPKNKMVINAIYVVKKAISYRKNQEIKKVKQGANSLFR